MDNRDHYTGLSIEDSIKVYYNNHDIFRHEFTFPLERILSKAIRQRIRELDGRTEEYMKKWHCKEWSIRMPFELKFPDKDGVDKYWIFLDTGVDSGSACIYASRIDENENVEQTMVEDDVNTLVGLYRNLKRMGFWDPEWAKSFNYTE